MLSRFRESKADHLSVMPVCGRLKIRGSFLRVFKLLPGKATGFEQKKTASEVLLLPGDSTPGSTTDTDRQHQRLPRIFSSRVQIQACTLLSDTRAPRQPHDKEED